MEEREEGMSLGEILSLMFKKKLVLLIITLAVAVVGIIGILAIYNPMKKNLYVDFRYDKTSLTSNSYSDGQPFRMEDLVSKENIEAVIASDEKYSVLNADDIYANAKYEVVLEKQDDESYKSYYKISILAKRLKNTELGKDFLEDLINNPIKDDAKIIAELDYKQQLEKYKTAKTYSDAFGYLNSAYALIQSEYNKLISTYGDVNFKDKNNNQQFLSSRLLDIQVYYKDQNLSTYLTGDSSSGLVVDYGLVLDYSFSRQSIQNELNETNDRLDLVNNQLTSIEEQYNAIYAAILDKQATILSADAQSVIQKKSDLSDQKIQLEKSKEKIELRLENETNTYVYVGIGGIKSETQYNALPDADKAQYSQVSLASQKAEIKTKLDNLYTYLSAQLDLVKQIRVDLDSEATYVYYQSNEVVRSTGGLNTILAVILSVLVGLVIGCITSFALCYGDFKAKKEKELAEKEHERMMKQISYQKMLKSSDSEDKEVE